MNKINLIGRVSNEPELRATEEGKHITTFNLAVQRNFKNSEGNYDADFFTCKVFNKLADAIQKYVKKGDRLGLSGAVHFSKYQDKDGNNRISTQVVVEDIDFLEPKKENKEVKEEETDPFKDFGDAIELTDEDLPF